MVAFLQMLVLVFKIFITKQISNLNENQQSVKQFVTDTLNIGDKLFKSLKVIIDNTIGVVAPVVKFMVENFILKPFKVVMKVINKIKEIGRELKKSIWRFVQYNRRRNWSSINWKRWNGF